MKSQPTSLCPLIKTCAISYRMIIHSPINILIASLLMFLIIEKKKIKFFLFYFGYLFDVFSAISPALDCSMLTQFRNADSRNWFSSGFLLLCHFVVAITLPYLWASLWEQVKIPAHTYIQTDDFSAWMSFFFFSPLKRLLLICS